MGARNFHSVNGTYYVPEGSEEWSLYEWENFQTSVEDAIYDMAESKNRELTDSYEDDHKIRDYGSSVLTSFQSEKKYTYRDDGDTCELYVWVTCVCTLRSGYYQGATLDYHFVYETDEEGSYGKYDELDFISDWNGNRQRDLVNQRQLERAENRAEKESERMEKAIDKLYRKHTDAYIVGVSFSNGETFYRNERCMMSEI